MTTREINPYASPRQTRRVAWTLPQRWFWWMVCDGLYLGATLGFLAGAAAFLLRLLLVPASNLPLPQSLLTALLIAVCICGQAFISAGIFGAILGGMPSLPPTFKRLLIVFLPLFFQPLFLLFIERPDAVRTSFGFCILIGALFSSYALYLTSQNVNLFLTDISRLRRTASAPQASLLLSNWMHRVIEVTLPEGPVQIEYNGRTIGTEKVLLNGIVMGRSKSYLRIVRPRYDFSIGARQVEVHLSGWPWSTLRSLVIAIDGVQVYSEGY